MAHVLTSILYTLLGALAIALFQVAVKVISRLKNLQNGGGFKSLIKEDDFAFWHEWMVAALVAMTIKVVGNSSNNAATALNVTITFIVMIVAGLLVVPFINAFLLSDDNGRLRNPWGIVVADLLGLIFLVTSVVVGVQVYG